MSAASHPYAPGSPAKAGLMSHDPSHIVLAVELGILLVLYAVGVHDYGPLATNVSGPSGAAAAAHGARGGGRAPALCTCAVMYCATGWGFARGAAPCLGCACLSDDGTHDTMLTRCPPRLAAAQSACITASSSTS